MVELKNVKCTDPEIYEAIMKETGRQQGKIELIASENFVSESVMEAMGSPLTNKYAEGYPGKRLSLLNVLKRYLVQAMQMYSPTQVHRQTWPFSSHF